MMSVLVVLLIQIFSGILKRINNNTYGDFLLSIIGGSLPLALLGAQVIERNGIAVIFSLVGFMYFLVFSQKKS